MSSGKIHKANEGCACTMNSILEEEVSKHGEIICRVPLNHDLGLAGLTGAELNTELDPIKSMAETLTR